MLFFYIKTKYQLWHIFVCIICLDFILLLLTWTSLSVPTESCVPTDRIFADICMATVSVFADSVWHPTSCTEDVAGSSWERSPCWDELCNKYFKYVFNYEVIPMYTFSMFNSNDIFNWHLSEYNRNKANITKRAFILYNKFTNMVHQ